MTNHEKNLLRLVMRLRLCLAERAENLALDSRELSELTGSEQAEFDEIRDLLGEIDAVAAAVATAERAVTGQGFEHLRHWRPHCAPCSGQQRQSSRP